LRIIDILSLPDVIDKLEGKHNLQPYEVEEVLMGRPGFRRVERGKVRVKTCTWRLVRLKQDAI
jgi:hypothetical protein